MSPVVPFGAGMLLRSRVMNLVRNPLVRRRLGPVGVVVLAILASIRAAAQGPVMPSDLPHLDPAVVELIESEAARVRQQPKTGRAHGRLGLVYEANLLWEEAAASFALAAALDPGEKLWRLHHAVALRQSGDFNAALEALRALGAAEPDFAPAWQRLGEALLEAGDLDGAEAAFQRVAELVPRAAEGPVGLGAVALRRKDAARAAEILAGALRLDPGYKRAHYLRGLALRDLSRDDPSLRQEASRELTLGAGGGGAAVRYLPDALSPALEGYAVNLTARLARAAGLLAAGRAPEAAAELERAVAAHPASVTAANNLAAAYLRLNRLDEARQILGRALTLDDSRFSTYLNLASWALRSRHTKEALGYADSAVERAPDLASPHFIRAQILLALGRTAEAMASARTAVEKDPSNPQHPSLAGDIALRLGHLEEAEDLYRQALAGAPNLVPALLGLARLSLATGRLDEAEKALAGARKEIPGHPQLQALEQQLAAARRGGGGRKPR